MAQSMESLALAPLNGLSTHLQSLVQYLTTSTTYSSALSQTSALISADDSLTHSLTLLKQHQRNYAHILHLRTEAKRLEDEIKTTIRNAVSLRHEIGTINPTYLDSDSDDSSGGDEEEETTSTTVDYTTLLNFAARIGKHNSLASLAAQRDSDRRKIAATSQQEQQQPEQNQRRDTHDQDHPAAGDDSPPDDITRSAHLLDDEAAHQRALSGLAFPMDEVLRNGLLGRLQYISEQEGEKAMEKEVERMIRETEGVGLSEGVVTMGDVMELDEARAREEEESRTEREKEKEGKVQMSAPRPRRESVTNKLGAATAGGGTATKKTVRLDFGADDSDSEDDE